MGYIAHHAGEHAAALDHYSRALAIFRITGRLYVQALIHDQVGDIHAELGQRDDAAIAWQQALHLYREQHRTEDAEGVLRKLAARERAGGQG